MSVNTWSGRVAWEGLGGVTLLEELCHWVPALGFSKTCAIPSGCSLPAACCLPLEMGVSSSSAAMPPLHHHKYYSWEVEVQVNASFVSFLGQDILSQQQESGKYRYQTL